MITAADEYPFHQTAEPIAFAGTSRNFYDRFFFNGYSDDGSLFFAVAFGLYPQLGIMDGTVSVLKDGKQHNVRVSRRMSGDRSDLSVGPLSIEIEQPLQQSRIVLKENDTGISLDMRFIARHAPIEEPRFTRRVGTRAFVDFTRMTQNVSWAGTLRVGDDLIDLAQHNVSGTRDRSWGIRPVGAPDTQPPPQGNLSQFYWLWTPCNFDNHVAFSHTNDDEYGRPWNRRAGIEKLGGEMQEFSDVTYSYDWIPESRRLNALHLNMKSDDDEAKIIFTPLHKFHMSGLGYLHPEWGHGMDHGDSAFHYDVFAADSCPWDDPLYLHIQSVAQAELHYRGEMHKGIGVVEQLFLGEHQPTGMLEGLAVDQGART